MSDRDIQMVDLKRQYFRLQPEIDTAMQHVLQSGLFINGPQVKAFSGQLATYLSAPCVVPCGNGTDALQIALMGLDLQPGDEVIVPAFTYAAAVEVIALLGLTPVVIDVDPDTFNIDVRKIEQAISTYTKAIIVVHLFGQSCDMEPVLQIASDHKLFVIEDNAQSLGADYLFSDGTSKKAGTIGYIGTTSFFPTKPLGCYGDGGAMITADPKLAERLRIISQHGQAKKYYHQLIGCNSRLDTLQAAILQIKLAHLDSFRIASQQVALRYDEELASLDWLQTPVRSSFSTHVYHQYTIQVKGKDRTAFQAYLKEKGIPSMIYYPLAIQEQEAFRSLIRTPEDIQVATQLSRTALSLPIHTEMTEEEQTYIIDTIKEYE